MTLSNSKIRESNYAFQSFLYFCLFQYKKKKENVFTLFNFQKGDICLKLNSLTSPRWCLRDEVSLVSECAHYVTVGGVSV